MYDYLPAYIMYVCAHVCIWCPQRPEGYQMSQTWRYRWLQTTMLVLGIEPRSPAREVSTLGHWAVSPGPKLTFLARLPNQQALWVCLAKTPSTVLSGTHSMPSFLHGCWGSNSGPRLSRASVPTHWSISSPMYWFLILWSHERIQVST